MFERQIEETIALLRQQTIGADDSVRLKKILGAPIPDAVKRFFSLEAERWGEEELKRLTESTHFDYSEPEIRRKFVEITRASMEYSRFTSLEFDDILDRTVKLLFNYVCRPQWTLAKYIFADTTTVAAHQALDLMEHFPDYTHYRIVMREYFRKKGALTIGREKFEELISLVDNEIVRNLDSSGLGRLSAPIFELFNPGDDSEFIRVPIEALSIFYDDKDVGSVVDRLELEKQSSATLSMHELIMLVGETDFSAGIEIGELVTNLVNVADAGSEKDMPIPDVDFADDRNFAEDVEGADEIPTDNLDAVIEELDLRFDDDDEIAQRTQHDVIESLSSIEEPEPLAGEQETPDFSLFEEEEQKTEEAPTSERADLPDGLFIVDDEPAGSAEVADELAITLPHEEQPSAAEEDDFLKSLNLTEADFMESEVKHDMDAALPELNLDDLAELPDYETESRRSPAEAPIQEQVSGEGLIAETLLPESELDLETTSPEQVITELGDLNGMISSQDKRKYVKKLFARKEEAYLAAIDELNGKPTWREASECIDEIFLGNNVDMYSRIAVNFTDEIYRRYQKRKS